MSVPVPAFSQGTIWIDDRRTHRPNRDVFGPQLPRTWDGLETLIHSESPKIFFGKPSPSLTCPQWLSQRYTSGSRHWQPRQIWKKNKWSREIYNGTPCRITFFCLVRLKPHQLGCHDASRQWVPLVVWCQQDIPHISTFSGQDFVPNVQALNCFLHVFPANGDQLASHDLYS